MRLLLAVLLLSGRLFAQDIPVNVFTAHNGEWEVQENWSLSHSPASGEIVIIPSSATVIITKSIILRVLDLTVAGHLFLQDAQMEIEEKGRFIIAEKGGIHGMNNSKDEQLIIGKQIKFVASTEKEIVGFAMADAGTGESPEGFTTKKYRTPNIFYGDKKKELWSSNEHWSLGRLPGEGDAVMVPATIRAVIDEEQKFEDISITISGELVLRNAGLFLGETSSLIIDKEGTLISENITESENLTIGGLLKFEGQQEKKINGFAVANSLSGISPKGFSQDAILPIILQSFSGRRKNDNIILEWTTSGDETALRFDIQLQGSNNNWQTIGSLVTDQHSSNTNYSYSFKNTALINPYFRLAMINKDNHYEYSRILAIGKQGMPSPLEVYASSPNNIRVNFPASVKGKMQVRITDIQGHALKLIEVLPGQTHANFQLAKHGLIVIQVVCPEFMASRLWYSR